MFETMTSVSLMGLFAGLKYPLVSAGLAVAYCLGNWFYQSGYSNLSKDVAGARYTSPLAVLKPVGMMGSMIACVTACISVRHRRNPPCTVEPAASASPLPARVPPRPPNQHGPSQRALPRRWISFVCAPLAIYSPPLCACLLRLVGRTWHVGWHTLACWASMQSARSRLKLLGRCFMLG